jgi:hypothetical protein
MTTILVAPEALDRAEAAAIFADHCAGFGGLDLLVDAGLEELADPERSLRTSTAAGAATLVFRAAVERSAGCKTVSA